MSTISSSFQGDAVESLHMIAIAQADGLWTSQELTG
jgi:hypothetical protein